MTLTAKRLDELMPDATRLESDEPELKNIGDNHEN